MKKLKKFLTGALIALGFASVFALSYQWTSFSKNDKPITLPPTQFCSGTTVSGNMAIGGNCYLKVGESGANYSLVPLYDSNGNIYITGGYLSGYLTGFTESDPIWNSQSGNYLLKIDSGSYYLANPSGYLTASALSPYVTLIYLTGGYYTTGEVDLKISGLLSYKGAWDISTGVFPHPVNTGEYYIIIAGGTGGSIYYGTGDMIIANKKKTSPTSIDFDHVVNTVRPEVDPVFMANSGVYFLTHSGEYFLANSGGYYTANPLGYITGAALNPYVLMSMTGNRNTAFGRGNHAGLYVTIANSGTYYDNKISTSLAPYCPLSVTGNWNTAYNNINSLSGQWNYFFANSGSYRPWTGQIVWPGVDTLVPTTKAVADYIDLYSLSLGSVITSGAYILSGNTANVACLSGQGQVAMSGGSISFQICSGTARVEVSKASLP